MDPKDIILSQEQLTAIFSAIHEREMASLRKRNEELKAEIARHGRVFEERGGSQP